MTHLSNERQANTETMREQQKIMSLTKYILKDKSRLRYQNLKNVIIPMLLDSKFKENKASSQTRHARLFVEFPRTRGMLVPGYYLQIPWYVVK